MGNTALTRRALIGAAALVGAGTVTGCSSLPTQTWLDRGPVGIDGMLDRLDPATFLDDDRALFHATWSRPQAAAEALEIDPSANLKDSSVPMVRLKALLSTVPEVLQKDRTVVGIDPWEMMSTPFLITPTEALCVNAAPGEVALWADAAELLEEIEPALGGMFEREGDSLRVVPEFDAGPGDQFTSLIAPVGKDLLLTMEEDTSHVDTDASAAEHFEYLPALLEALDLEDAHLITLHRDRVGGSFGPMGGPIPEGDATVPEWIWATRFDSPEEHTSLGVLRVVGDARAYREQMLAYEELHHAGSSSERPGVAEAEVDGEFIHVTFDSDVPVDTAEARDVLDLHRYRSIGGPSSNPLDF